MMDKHQEFTAGTWLCFKKKKKKTKKGHPVVSLWTETKVADILKHTDE